MNPIDCVRSEINRILDIRDLNQISLDPNSIMATFPDVYDFSATDNAGVKISGSIFLNFQPLLETDRRTDQKKQVGLQCTLQGKNATGSSVFELKNSKTSEFLYFINSNESSEDAFAQEFSILPASRAFVIYNPKCLELPRWHRPLIDKGTYAAWPVQVQERKEPAAIAVIIAPKGGVHYQMFRGEKQVSLILKYALKDLEKKIFPSDSSSWFNDSNYLAETLRMPFSQFIRHHVRDSFTEEFSRWWSGLHPDMVDPAHGSLFTVALEPLNRLVPTDKVKEAAAWVKYDGFATMRGQRIIPYGDGRELLFDLLTDDTHLKHQIEAAYNIRLLVDDFDLLQKKRLLQYVQDKLVQFEETDGYSFPDGLDAMKPDTIRYTKARFAYELARLWESIVSNFIEKNFLLREVAVSGLQLLKAKHFNVRVAAYGMLTKVFHILITDEALYVMARIKSEKIEADGVMIKAFSTTLGWTGIDGQLVSFLLDTVEAFLKHPNAQVRAEAAQILVSHSSHVETKKRNQILEWVRIEKTGKMAPEETLSMIGLVGNLAVQSCDALLKGSAIQGGKSLKGPLQRSPRN